METSQRIDRSLWGILASLLVLVFLLNRYDVPNAFDLFGWTVYPASLLCLVCLGAAWSVRRRQPRNSTKNLRGLLPAFVCWFGLALIATLLSRPRGEWNAQGLSALLMIGVWTAPIWIVPRLGLGKKSIRWALFAYCLCAFAGAFLTVAQSLVPEAMRVLFGWRYVPYMADSEVRGVLPLGVSTTIGIFYLTALPFGYRWMIDGERRFARLAGAALVVTMAVGCLFTASRSTIGLLVLVVVGCFFWLGRGKGKAGAIQIAVLVILVGILGVSLVAFNFERLTEVGDSSVTMRTRGVEIALEMIRDKPLLGHGTETHFRRQYGTALSNYLSPIVDEVIRYDYRLSPREPHNLYLLVASEWGLLGLGAFFFFLYRIGRSLFGASSSEANSNEELVSKCFAIGFVTMLIHSLSGSDLVSRNRIALLFWIFCGLGIAYSNLRDSEGSTESGSG